MIEPALTAGFVSCGLDVILVGPMPTPAIAMLTRSLRADLGVMISASHNSYEDNGIKIFGPDGYKLSDEVEAEIEARSFSNMAADLAKSPDLGRTYRLDDAQGRYTEFVKQSFPKGNTLDGLKVVVDCAHGAAYKVAPEVLWELGAEVIAIGVDPDGFNINKDCGSTQPERMCAEVVATGSHLGIALDGDADRVIVCDEKGELVDGDQLMALVAKSMKDKGTLKNNTLISTVMSNLGLENYLKSIDIFMHRTAVGDRYVVEAMRKMDCNIGGEQSGHIVLGDISTTGDGLIAALQVLAVLSEDGRTASEVCRLFDPLPQLLQNVRFDGASPLDQDGVQDAIKAAEKQLEGSGRLLIRKSGTEPLIRVMAEGSDAGLVKQVVNDLSQTIERAC
ncbi:MAG: phosphoglucosamine mutase, partial [Rhodospirillaceae bacterium]|nr:phosphoglucosamine mutase [Rhodospirillaceae bacterium]